MLINKIIFKNKKDLNKAIVALRNEGIKRIIVKGKTINFQYNEDKEYDVTASIKELSIECIGSIIHQWANKENIGTHCGEWVLQQGQIKKIYLPSLQTNSIEFACKVLDTKPKKEGFYLFDNNYIDTKQMVGEVIEFLGKKVLFFNERIKQVPKGLYIYHFRHGDDGTFASIEPKVGVNHAGSLVTKRPIKFSKGDFLSIDDENYPNFLGEEMSVYDYMIIKH